MPSTQSPIEFGTFAIIRESSGQVVILYPDCGKTAGSPTKPTDVRSRDANDRARSMQAMLDSGAARSRSQLAEHFGISRARVTQILGRMNRTSSKEVVR